MTNRELTSIIYTMNDQFLSGKSRQVGGTTALVKRANEIGAIYVVPNHSMGKACGAKHVTTLSKLDVRGWGKKVIFDPACFQMLLSALTKYYFIEKSGDDLQDSVEREIITTLRKTKMDIKGRKQ